MGVEENEIPTATAIVVEGTTGNENAAPMQQHQSSTEVGAVYKPNASDEEKSKAGTKFCFAMTCIMIGTVSKAARWVIPKKIIATSIMGGIELDFSNGIFMGDVYVTAVPILCAGLDITIPPGVKVVNNGVAICGGIDDPGMGSGDINTPTIYVNGLVICGGVKIQVNTVAIPLRVES